MICHLILRIFGWNVRPIAPDFPTKSVIIVAPHTSNWDFFWGILAGRALNLPFLFVIKDQWNLPCIGHLLTYLGARFISRSGNTGVTTDLIRCMRLVSCGHMVIAPEGTRSFVSKWRTGFYHIAHVSKVPISIATIDYTHKRIGILGIVSPTGNMKRDCSKIRDMLHGSAPKYRQKFNMNWTI